MLSKRIRWDSNTNRLFEIGVDRGVLYPNGRPGVPWNGLVAVNEEASGGEIISYYIDGVKYWSESTLEEYQATIQAYTYPDEFSLLDGSEPTGTGLFFGEQERLPFDLVYRTRVGNDIHADQFGYKIHMIYDAIVAPSPQDNSSQGEDVDPVIFSWPIAAIAQQVPGHKPTAHLIVDSTKTDKDILLILEGHLYGTEDTEPYLPSMAEVEDLINSFYFALRIRPLEPAYALRRTKAIRSDLIGNPRTGLYQKTPNSRIEETHIPGIGIVLEN